MYATSSEFGVRYDTYWSPLSKGEVQVGSESDATGEGDVVGETEAPRSETPAETPAS